MSNSDFTSVAVPVVSNSNFVTLAEPAADRYRLISQNNERLAIFVHGLFSGHLKQWHGFHEILSSRASDDPTLSTWNYLFLGYDSQRIRSYRQIAELIGTQCRRAAAGTHEYMVKHHEFAFVGFSLGTLGIREYVANCTLQPRYTSIRSVGLYGTPLVGSMLADLAKEIAPGRIFEQLSRESTTLRMLRDWSRCSYQSHGQPKNKLYLGIKDHVVHYGAPSVFGWEVDETPPDVSNTGHSLRSLINSGEFYLNLVDLLQ